MTVRDVTSPAQQDAAVARRALAKKHAKDNAQRAADLVESRDRLAAAIASAQDALLGLVDATTAYSGQIRQQAAELAAEGFSPLVDGAEVGTDPRAGVVVLGGETARVLDPGTVLRHVVERVQFTRLQPREYWRVHQQGRGRIADAASAAVVALVDPPKPISQDGMA